MTAFDDLGAIFRTATLAQWLERFGDEEVCVGPVLAVDEAAAELGAPAAEGRGPELGEHTELWRRRLGL